MFTELFYEGLPICGIWQDNGLLKNNTALPMGKSSVTVILTDFFHTYTMEIADNDVLSFMSEQGFDSVIWAVEDGRQKCAIRAAILGK